MSEEYELEEELRKKAEVDKDSDAEDFWHRYNVMKKFLKEQYYPWVQSNCNYYTDHGEKHIRSVIRTISDLLKGKLNTLSSLDLFLLLTSVIWHDVGMVSNRSNHAEETTKIIEKIKGQFPNVIIQNIVSQIVKAHSGEDNLTIPPWNQDCNTSFKAYTVFSKSFAALIRFADEISEDYTRVNMDIIEQVPDKQKIYWHYANCIQACMPELKNNMIKITLAISSKFIAEEFECPKEFLAYAKGGKISLMEYIICRIEKMNNERAYCCPIFYKYTAIDHIEFRFNMMKDSEYVGDYKDHKIIIGSFDLGGQYPSIKLYEEFFKKYPDWKLDAIQKVIKDE